MLPAGGGLTFPEAGARAGNRLGRPETPFLSGRHWSIEPRAKWLLEQFFQITEFMYFFWCKIGPICFFLLHSILPTQPTLRLFLQDVNVPTRATPCAQGTPDSPRSPRRKPAARARLGAELRASPSSFMPWTSEPSRELESV